MYGYSTPKPSKQPKKKTAKKKRKDLKIKKQ